MALREDQELGPYVLRALIGKGGMGEVWRAWDTSSNKDVAVKAVASDLMADPGFQQRFLDEINRHSRLDHPNIVPVLDTFEASGQSCMVMKLVEGQSLKDLLDSRDDRILPPADAIPIIQDVLEALDYAHRQGVFHRDVKPSNILIDARWQAHLIDFGIAIAVGQERRTRLGAAVGTALYMSPEQIRAKHIDHRTDVYSVGCVLYEMLTGRPPFVPDPDAVGDTDFVIKEMHIHTPPVPPRQLVPSIPARLNELILRSLVKNPDERLFGCQEFSKGLRGSSSPVSIGIVERVKERPLAAALVIASIIFLLVVIWANS